MIAATVPYGLAMKLVASLCGIEVSVKGVEQMVERRAERGAAGGVRGVGRGGAGDAPGAW